ncbi:alpha-2,3-sialyltransferase [Sinorhizobium psoraleae]|uniref:Alpha-2,3-sialyltransferase n=1 Tax=Sinorhizobium psoraleae TaxID=520838 RepID=A0ABT4KM56_9HYPH|nr:alpha-2,3-sialyltransferase [Sinorhizobium psoraleae]MCZ4093040.1 alpha-2,3-sialyltransferase [Sinorhizobium psoraleae]
MSFPKNSLSVPSEIERIKRHFEGRLHQDCYIVGNGPSSAEVRLSEEQVANSVIFRANWFFLEKEKFYGDRVDGFFWSVDNAGLRDNLKEIQRLDQYKIDAFFQPFQASDLREKVVTASAAHLMPNFDHWAVIASNPTLARFMMGRPLPTQGMQMIAVAAILGFKKIHISGIDLYADMAQRYAWDVPDTVRAHLQEKDIAAGYEKSTASTSTCISSAPLASSMISSLSGSPAWRLWRRTSTAQKPADRNRSPQTPAGRATSM